MAKDVRVVEVDDFDHRLLVKGLNQLRNQAIEQDVPTDDVDDLLLRVIEAPEKKPRWRSREER